MTNTITIPNIDGVELNILSELKINPLVSFLRCSFGIHLLWVIWILPINNSTANLVN